MGIYKGDKVTTNGLSEQHVFEIKQDYYGNNIPVGKIADKMGLTVIQVLYAVKLNEVTKPNFKDLDFEI